MCVFVVAFLLKGFPVPVIPKHTAPGQVSSQFVSSKCRFLLFLNQLKREKDLHERMCQKTRPCNIQQFFTALNMIVFK